MNDPKVLDFLTHKGRQDYQETMNCWSQEPHILGLLLAPNGRPERTFLERFYEGTSTSQMSWSAKVDSCAWIGRDEDQVLPAATGALVKDNVI